MTNTGDYLHDNTHQGNNRNEAVTNLGGDKAKKLAKDLTKVFVKTLTSKLAKDLAGMFAKTKTLA